MPLTAEQLAKTFGTPLVVIDENRLRAQLRRFRAAFKHPRWTCRIVYAAKALTLAAIARIVHEEGLWFDACSEGELATALRAGTPPSECVLHGCAKTAGELELAVRAGVRFIVVDNEEEIAALRTIARGEGTHIPVLLRVNVDVAAPTRKQIQTSTPESKFGIPIQDGQAEAAARRMIRSESFAFHGLHCHLGSEIADLGVYADAVRKLAALASALERTHGVHCEILNVGGGLAASDGAGQPNNPTPEAWAGALFAAMGECFAGGDSKRTLLIEPGRAILCGAGATLYTVAVRKTLATGEQAVIVDGGMSDNPRPALYGATYPLSIASREHEEPDGRYTIFGRHCETDLLFSGVPLPNPRAGDVLVVHDTGAYTYSMASNYNRFARPAVVLVHGESARVIARRESLDHLLALDVFDDAGETRSNA
jgi:diaminopimelate decarboxylase